MAKSTSKESGEVAPLSHEIKEDRSEEPQNAFHEKECKAGEAGAGSPSQLLLCMRMFPIDYMLHDPASSGEKAGQMPVESGICTR
jgi:hypothetical protein